MKTLAVNQQRGGSVMLIIAAVAISGCPRYQALNPQEIAAAHQSYLATEGHSERGLLFEKLVTALDTPESPGKHSTGKLFTRMNVFDYLGPPDMMRELQATSQFAYFYDRFGKKDWCVIVTFSETDPHAEFSFNAAETIEVDDWKEYEGEIKGVREIKGTGKGARNQ